jgi:hypothetical protein
MGGRRLHRWYAHVALAMCLACAALVRPAAGATVLYLTDGELVSHATRVVHARVLRIHASRGADGVVRTTTELAVIEDFTGVPGERLQMRELGGTVGGDELIVPGAPRLSIGDEVVVCLERGPGDTWRSVGLSLGTFRVSDIVPESSGADSPPLQRTDRGTHIVGRPAVVPRPATLNEFRRLVGAIKGSQAWRAPADAIPEVLVPEADSTVRQNASTTGFTLLGSGIRWSPADRGLPVMWYRNLARPAPVTGGNGDAEIGLALAAWTAPPTASIDLRFAGERDIGGSSPYCGNGNAGVGLISFEDPSGEMATNVLALGGGCSATGEFRSLNGITFQSFSHAFVVFNRASVLGTTYRTPVNFARILQHEVGHAIGLGHADSSLSRATSNIMFAACCYGSTPVPPMLGPDDLAGVEFIYPAIPLQSCSYSVAPLTATFGGGGGSGLVTVSTGSSCVWSGESLAPWIVLTAGAPRRGSATLAYAVTANGGPLRRGGLRVAGQEVVITQVSSDGDADGLPDDWEQLFGLDPTSASGADGAGGDPDRDGVSNAGEHRDGSHPRGFYRQLFAEGATGGFFDVRFAVFNPGAATSAHVLARAMTGAGAQATLTFALAPRARRTLRPATDFALPDAEFATIIESDVLLVADRTMTWDARQYGAHAETGVPAPASRWYFAEGATHSGFDLFYQVSNPDTRDVVVRVRYLLPAPAAALERSYRVAARSRRTVWVNFEDPALGATDVAVVLTTPDDQPVVVERTMYLSRAGEMFAAGHASGGTRTPGTNWYFAEGATGPFFDTFLLVANPTGDDATIQITYLLPGGAPVVVPHVVHAESRLTVWVDADHPQVANSDAGIEVHSTNGVPVVVERAMWWPGSAAVGWDEAHVNTAFARTASRWALANVDVGGTSDASTFVLVANASPVSGDVSVTLTCEDAPPAALARTFRIGASSRRTIDVRAEFPSAAGRACSALVESAAPSLQLLVERATYWSAQGRFWAAGAATGGVALP